MPQLYYFHKSGDGLLLTTGKRLTIIFCLLLFLPVYVQADPLTTQQIERVKACKLLIEEVDAKSLRQTVRELEDLSYTEENIQIMEAMADTYLEIVRENKVNGQKNKEWLHSMIALNMGYLQMGGSAPKGDNAPLNRLICRKLKEHLSEELLRHPVLFRPFKY